MIAPTIPTDSTPPRAATARRTRQRWLTVRGACAGDRGTVRPSSDSRSRARTGVVSARSPPRVAAHSQAERTRRWKGLMGGSPPPAPARAPDGPSRLPATPSCGGLQPHPGTRCSCLPSKQSPLTSSLKPSQISSWASALTAFTHKDYAILSQWRERRENIRSMRAEGDQVACRGRAECRSAGVFTAGEAPGRAR
jgi:hypothetical protein